MYASSARLSTCALVGGRVYSTAGLASPTTMTSYQTTALGLHDYLRPKTLPHTSFEREYPTEFSLENPTCPDSRGNTMDINNIREDTMDDRVIWMFSKP